MGHIYTDYRSVVVVWRDSHSNFGWQAVRDIDVAMKPIVTIGFLVNETKTTITIVNSIGGWDIVESPMTIPWKNVVFFDDIKLPNLKRELQAGRE